MAPWWLRTHKDEQLDDPSAGREAIDGASTESARAADEDPSDSGRGTEPDAPNDSATPTAQAGGHRRESTAADAPDTSDAAEAPGDEVAAPDTAQSKVSATARPQDSDDPGDTATNTPRPEGESSETPAKRKRRRRRRRRKPADGAARTDGPTQSPESEHRDAGDPAPQAGAAPSAPVAATGEASSEPSSADPAPAPVEQSSAQAGTEDSPPSRTAAPPTAMAPSPVSTPSATTSAASGSSQPVERNYVFSFPERSSSSEERKLALFCDFENIALGVRSSEIQKLDVNLILARLLEKGKIIVKKAYADWERYNEYKRPLHEAAIELIDIPQKYYSGKNSADIKLVVDAMDLCYSKEHLDTFVILSGDSDFSPLVSKLKENDKVVIGVGIKDSSSSLLVDNCDEFVFYEDIWRAAQTRPILDNLPPQKAEVFGLMADAMLALLRENKEVLWGSLVKQTMQRKNPAFTEGYYGYGSFSEMLEDAEQHKIIGLRKDQRSGNYVITGFVN